MNDRNKHKNKGCKTFKFYIVLSFMFFAFRFYYEEKYIVYSIYLRYPAKPSNISLPISWLEMISTCMYVCMCLCVFNHSTGHNYSPIATQIFLFFGGAPHHQRTKI